MKCQATENTYSKIARSSPSMYRSCIKSSKCKLKIIPIYFTSIINFNYSIRFSSFRNTTKWKELFSLNGTTFIYILISDWWISGLTPIVTFLVGGVVHVLKRLWFVWNTIHLIKHSTGTYIITWLFFAIFYFFLIFNKYLHKQIYRKI